MEPKESEDKIVNAARKVFRAKGFKATRTRDIAEEAGVNLALINYYYKNKQTLFEEIISESILTFRSSIIEATNNPNTTIQEKIHTIVDNYYNLFTKEPDLPLFIFHEVNVSTEFLISKMNPNGIIHGSFFEKQLLDIGKSKDEIEQIFVNILSLTVCPFAGKIIIKNLCGDDDTKYQMIMEQRCKKIPQWISLMFNL